MTDNSTFWLPQASSTTAGDVDALFYFIYAVSVVSFVLLVGATFMFAWKYRKREGGPKLKQFTHGVWLEVTWSVIPALILFFIFAWGFRSFMNLQVAPHGATEIFVTAQKWSWEFTYPGGKTTNGELHIPVDKPVKLIMRSKDVIHSFFIPEFRAKADVIPGRYSTLWFQTKGVGEARIAGSKALLDSEGWDTLKIQDKVKKNDGSMIQVFCAEYCGESHSRMYALVIPHAADEFDEWLKEGDEIDPGLPLEEQGKIVYAKNGCNACHSVDGSKVVGPSFKGIWGRTEKFTDGSEVQVDENYIRQSIREPKAKIVEGYPPAMPPYPVKSISDEHIDKVIAYIKSLN